MKSLQVTLTAINPKNLEMALCTGICYASSVKVRGCQAIATFIFEGDVQETLTDCVNPSALEEWKTEFSWKLV
jgi:hypothetical protein